MTREIQRRDSFCQLIAQTVRQPGIIEADAQSLDFLRHPVIFCSKDKLRNQIGTLLMDLKLAVSSKDREGVRESGKNLADALELNLVNEWGLKR